MLRITQNVSPDSAKSYFAQADYYAEGQELVGQWIGEGAKRLGLEGRIDGKAFNRLCDNLHPITSKPLTPRHRSDRTVGYDFTFSVPKSVSVLYAMTEDPAILDAFRDSMRETMEDIEAEMKTRVRMGGKNAERVTGNAVGGEYIHFTGRPDEGVVDMHLHGHCFMFNVTYDGVEDRWKAGQFRDLKREAPYFQAAFRARLANRLQDLGFAIDRKKDDFEIRGMPTSAIKEFSRRTAKIEAIAEAKGITDPKEKDKLGGKTREKKDKNLTWQELRHEWKNRLKPDEQNAIEQITASRGTHDRPGKEDVQAVDFAIKHLFERDTVVSEKRLLAVALKRGVGNVTIEGVRTELAKRNLLTVERDGQKLMTTREIVAQEEKLVKFASDGRGTCRPLGIKGRTLKRDWLNADQRRAVKHVLSSRDRVIMIRGAAGTGKTTVAQEIVEAIEQGGHLVTALAPTGSAAFDVLREHFADADTLARFLRDETMQQQAAGQVVLLDEAGLVGNRDMAELFDIGERENIRFVFMGDRQQHKSVAAGAPLKLLEQQAGVPSVEIREIIRQEDADYKKAVKLLSEGKTGEGFDAIDKLGWIEEVANTKCYARMAEAYLDAATGKKKDGKERTALAVSPTHAEAALITNAVRKELTAKGKLKDEREFSAWVPKHLTEAERGEASSIDQGDLLQFYQNAKGFRSGSRLIAGNGHVPVNLANRFQVYRPVTLKLAVGDRLRITARGETMDGKHRLNTGSLFTVNGFTKEGNIIVNKDWVIAKEFGHVAHGYVVTSHASQGKTVDTILIGESSVSHPGSSREGFYVEASRGKQKAIIFTDDKAALRDAVTRNREQPTATEIFRPRKPTTRERLREHFIRMGRYNWPRERIGQDYHQPLKEAVHER